MPQQELRTVIALSGRVDNSFGTLGTALINIGSQIDAVSQKVINFGKESVKEYVRYDDIMRDVQALGEYDDKTINALTEYNKAIAQTSKYTMEQAGQAEVLMAQLGLNIEQTKTLMPSVMDMATAANIGLADSLDYLYYTLNALDEPMGYANTLSDQMAKTAAISAADINTLGESMQRLGSGVQFFAGGSGEILAILGGISKFGADMQGTNAGTQLRNFMLTLLAPTKSKQKIMDAFKVSEEEWAEFESYMEDAGIDVTNTADAMNSLGLSVYDTATGELKPAIQILGELNAALSSMSEAEKNAVLGNLFGKRTTTTALNLLASLETIIEYQEMIENGSSGYTQYMAAIKEAGLGGTLRDLNASWDALKVVVGDTLEPDVNFWASGFNDIVDSIANLDELKLSALVGAGEGLAASGKALLSAGLGFKFIGWALTPAGKWAIGLSALAIAAGAAYKTITKLNEIDLKSGFGSMDLDTETLTANVKAIGDEFEATYNTVDKYNGALDTALTNYETASTTLSGKLTTAMITGATLTESDVGAIQALGSTMGTELLRGIEASFNSSAAYLEMLYGGVENMAGNEAFIETGALFGLMYNSVIGDAKKLGQEFGATLGEAMDDGIITGDEYTVIMEKMRAYSQAMAVAAGAENAGEIEKRLFNASTVSWDSAEDFLTATQAEMEDVIAQSNAEHAYQIGQTKYWYDQAIAKGITNPSTGMVYTAADRDEAVASMNAAQAEIIADLRAGYAQVFDKTFDAMFSSAGDFAFTYMERLLAEGGLTLDENNQLPAGFDYTAFLPEGRSAEEIVEGLRWLQRNEGTFSNLFEGYLSKEAWQDAQTIFGMALSVAEALHIQSNATSDYTAYADAIRAVRPDLDQLYATGAMQADDAVLRGLRDRIAALSGTDDSLDDLFAALAMGDNDTMASAIDNATTHALDIYDEILAAISEAYDVGKILAGSNHAFARKTGNPYQLDYAAYSLLYGDASRNSGVYNLYGDSGAAMEILVSVSGAEEEALLALEDAQAVMDNGVTIPVTFSGPRSNAFTNLRIPGLPQYAEGGRATEASIFGEAGPEWAIPEEHSARTASLLDAARAASGFTWPELIQRNGGLNAGRVAPTQIIYSPVIHARDARGVEEKLIEDKERLERWWQEKRMRDEVEVYT